MDAVQDKDLHDPLLRELGPSVLLNVASGYYFSASKLMNQYHNHEIIADRARLIIEDFYDHFLIMCSGQYQDLVQDKPSIKQYWEIAQSKSGIFFSMACRFGANLATSDQHLLDGYAKYGNHLGVLVQIYDDLEEIDHIEVKGEHGNSSGIKRSLPVVYALETLPQGKADYLVDCLANLSDTADEIVELIDQSGAGFYIDIEIQKHRNEAILALNKVEPLSPAGEKLLALLPDLS
jgi:geranylgeranyl pyrophosphate synthase